MYLSLSVNIMFMKCIKVKTNFNMLNKAIAHTTSWHFIFKNMTVVYIKLVLVQVYLVKTHHNTK